MELKRNRCEPVCIFFMYFLANNSKILSSYRLSPILLSRPSVRPGQRSVRVWKLVEVGETLERRWRDTRRSLGGPTIESWGRVEQRGASFPVATFSYHFPCVLLSCVHRLGVVDPAQPEADCGHSKRQRERDWRRREPTVEQTSLCRSSTVLSPPRPTLLLPSSPCLLHRARARACACLARTSRIP